jgi:hypothetical protein
LAVKDRGQARRRQKADGVRAPHVGDDARAVEQVVLEIAGKNARRHRDPQAALHEGIEHGAPPRSHESVEQHVDVAGEDVRPPQRGNVAVFEVADALAAGEACVVAGDHRPHEVHVRQDTLQPRPPVGEVRIVHDGVLEVLVADQPEGITRPRGLERDHLVDDGTAVEELDEQVDARPGRHVLIEAIGHLVPQGQEAAADQLHMIFDLVNAVRVVIGQQKMEVHRPLSPALRSAPGRIAIRLPREYGTFQPAKTWLPAAASASDAGFAETEAKIVVWPRFL